MLNGLSGALRAIVDMANKTQPCGLAQLKDNRLEL